MTVQAPVERQVIRASDVARLLGWRSVESFYNNRDKLLAAGFPEKLEAVNGWSRPAIMRWLETNGETYAPPEPEAAAIRALERRYAP